MLATGPPRYTLYYEVRTRVPIHICVFGRQSQFDFSSPRQIIYINTLTNVSDRTASIPCFPYLHIFIYLYIFIDIRVYRRNVPLSRFPYIRAYLHLHLYLYTLARVITDALTDSHNTPV